MVVTHRGNPACTESGLSVGFTLFFMSLDRQRLLRRLHLRAQMRQHISHHGVQVIARGPAPIGAGHAVVDGLRPAKGPQGYGPHSRSLLFFSPTSVCLLSQGGSSQAVLCSGGLVDLCSPHQCPVVLTHLGAFSFCISSFQCVYSYWLEVLSDFCLDIAQQSPVACFIAHSACDDDGMNSQLMSQGHGAFSAVL